MASGSISRRTNHAPLVDVDLAVLRRVQRVERPVELATRTNKNCKFSSPQSLRKSMTSLSLLTLLLISSFGQRAGIDPRRSSRRRAARRPKTRPRRPRSRRRRPWRAAPARPELGHALREAALDGPPPLRECARESSLVSRRRVDGVTTRHGLARARHRRDRHADAIAAARKLKQDNKARPDIRPCPARRPCSCPGHPGSLLNERARAKTAGSARRSSAGKKNSRLVRRHRMDDLRLRERARVVLVDHQEALA